jgi:hypothetical protein
MSNELKHADPGSSLPKATYISTTAHIADGQIEGDTFYFNGTNWIRKPANYYNSTLQTTSNYSVAAKDYYIICDNATAITINLPIATGSGRIINIKNIGAGNATLNGDGSDTIDNELTQTLYQWEGCLILDYAMNKWVVL